ncbi:hypothetical protein OGAPHI_001707 [Ogataea philodendri]|uniref:Uncharacterized protein n=1 Tax=Ogataea philodendri TaxID=1378263 RepID=A0A9P8T6C6_9ASCO|nr:uncharacterized protein OGAPHI_001707 [Ogataea philodendri]KAH3667953.1 hypothetical protein OGAPHI_001707 [Ogataea philodendri]
MMDLWVNVNSKCRIGQNTPDPSLGRVVRWIELLNRRTVQTDMNFFTLRDQVLKHINCTHMGSNNQDPLVLVVFGLSVALCVFDILVLNCIIWKSIYFCKKWNVELSNSNNNSVKLFLIPSLNTVNGLNNSQHPFSGLFFFVHLLNRRSEPDILLQVVSLGELLEIVKNMVVHHKWIHVTPDSALDMCS